MSKRRFLTVMIGVLTGTSMVVGNGSGAFASEKAPVEIVSKRSEYEKHFDNGNGTVTAFINTVPLHYYENGQWNEIDNSLELNETGDYVNKSNSMNVTLSSDTSAKAICDAGEEQMVQIEYDGYSISWDMINLQMNIADQVSAMESNTVSSLKFNDNDDDHYITLGSCILTETANEYVDKLDSGVIYQSVYDGVDIDIDIMPTAVKETIILNSAESSPEQFAYYIMTEGLTAELKADNSIIFTNDSGEVIFTMPAMYMFDSSENAEHNYDIETTLEPFKTGYLLTITPDSEWLANDERVYPVMIDPEVLEDSGNVSDSYIVESSPNTNFSDQYLKMGGWYSDGMRKETFIKYTAPLNFHSSVEIIEANLVLYFASNDLSGINPNIEVSLLTQDPGQPTWNTIGDGLVSSIEISEFTVNEYAAGDHEIDITQAMTLWLNYTMTNQVAGAANFGLKLAPENPEADNRTLTAFSSRYQTLAPYFSITYTSNTDSSPYTMAYLPEKYNSLGTIDNFQNRMNCYAYALQVYYNGELGEGEAYYLKPGEFGIANSSLSNNYNTLKNYYVLASPTGYNFNYASSRLKFIDERMREDAETLSFNLSEAFQIQNGEFVLPSNFSEDNGRIIALTTAMYYGMLEYHFYVRNGNGTCQNGHGGNCSEWSHKPSNGVIKNTSFSDNTVLCDNNITTYVGDNNNTVPYTSDVNYYIISKDVHLYNSWHGDGHDANSTGTPYRQ